MKKLGFSKRQRLVKNCQFKSVLAQGRRRSNSLLRLYVTPNALDYARLGVSVGRPCGNAIARNRLKRLMREAFRQNQAQIEPGYDYVLLVSARWAKPVHKARRARRARQIGLDQVKQAFTDLLQKDNNP